VRSIPVSGGDGVDIKSHLRIAPIALGGSDPS
jgi:hypothetical protein